MSGPVSYVVGPVAPTPDELDEVFELYRTHSNTLGFLPRGAFEQFASDGHVLAARASGKLAGYLAYRFAGGTVVIVHLCVCREHRGKGTARVLIEALIASEGAGTIMRLWCRTDYVEANRIWPKFHFVCRGERPGRGQGSARLYHWVRQPHGELPLLELMQEASLEGRSKVVLDANVFFDLHSDSPRSEESRALLADWLEPDIVLCVTAELLNEISRHGSKEIRARRRSEARQFETLEGSPVAVDAAYNEIDALLPRATKASDASDRRQLAHAAVKRAEFFVTRDTALLDRADVLRAAMSIEVVRPADLLVRVHAEQDPFSYAPARLVGTRINHRLVRSEAEMLPFQQFGRQESKADWLRRCRESLRDPRRYESKVVVPEDAEPRVLYTVDATATDVVRVALLRTLAHPLTATVVRRIAAECLARAADTGRARVEVEEKHDVVVREALTALGFHETKAGYAKVTLANVAAASDVAEIMQQRAREHSPPIAGATHAELERRLWPLKIRDTESPSYMIPIRPSWAAQLFDAELADQELFGADEGIGLGLENVYYSASPVHIPPGARILWYVSKDKGGARVVREVRACSHSLGTARGPARQVFPRFSRLGVYRWADVLRTAKSDPMGQVTAYRFAFTERLSKPVGWGRLQELLEAYGGKGSPVAGPTPIAADAFAAIYGEATGRYA